MQHRPCKHNFSFPLIFLIVIRLSTLRNAACFQRVRGRGRLRQIRPPTKAWLLRLVRPGRLRLPMAPGREVGNLALSFPTINSSLFWQFSQGRLLLRSHVAGVVRHA